MNPYDKARELKKAIEVSQEYKSFIESKKQLEEDSAAKEMVEDFQEKQFELQRRQLMGEEISQEELDKTQELFGILSMNKLAADYMAAEFAYARLMQDISEVLAELME